MTSLHAARRHRWRLAGGRLHVDAEGVRFVPDPLERRFGAEVWACPASSVTAIRVGGTFCVVVDTDGGPVTFRLARPARAAARLSRELHPDAA